MYKRLITYNFENDDTRNSFVELITGLGFEEQPDQSTYAQKRRNPVELNALKSQISRWSNGVQLSAEDKVQIYYISTNNLIGRNDMRYDRLHNLI